MVLCGDFGNFVLPRNLVLLTQAQPIELGVTSSSSMKVTSNFSKRLQTVNWAQLAGGAEGVNTLPVDRHTSRQSRHERSDGRRTLLSECSCSNGCTESNWLDPDQSDKPLLDARGQIRDSVAQDASTLTEIASVYPPLFWKTKVISTESGSVT